MEKHLIVFTHHISTTTSDVHNLGNNFQEVIGQHIGLDDYDKFNIISMSQSQETVGDTTLLIISVFVEVERG